MHGCRVGALLLALIMCVGLAGCASAEPAAPRPVSAAAPSAPPSRQGTSQPATLPPSLAPAPEPRPTPSVAATIDPLLPVPISRFDGRTSQDTRVRLTVGPGPALVYPTQLTLSWTCDDGTRSASSWALAPGQSQPLESTTFDLFVGFEQGWSGRFTSPDRVEGSGRFRMTINDASGEMTCDSGEFTWSAKLTDVTPLVPVDGPVEATTLQEALAAGYVTMDVRGTGASSGDSIVMTVGSLVDVSLDLELPEGSELRSRARELQDMVVRGVKGTVDASDATTYSPTDAIRLEPGDTRSYLVEAYCLDFHAGNPQATTAFTLRGPVGSRVVRVLRAADDDVSTAPSIAAIQAAVWALTDDVARGELRSRFVVSGTDLRTAKALVAAAGLRPADYRLFR